MNLDLGNEETKTLIESIGVTFAIGFGLRLPLDYMEDYLLNGHGITDKYRMCAGLHLSKWKAGDEAKQIFETAAINEITYRIVRHKSLCSQDDPFVDSQAKCERKDVFRSVQDTIASLITILALRGISLEQYARVKKLETGVFNTYEDWRGSRAKKTLNKEVQ